MQMTNKKVSYSRFIPSLIQKGLPGLFLILLVLLVLLQANPLFNLPSRDGGIYGYIGHIILEGKTPYIDAWESKPPGIFYLNAAALWLGHGTRWGIWLVEFAFLFTATAIGYKILSRTLNTGSALFGTIIWLLGLNRVLQGGNFTEEYPLLFNFLALFLFWKSWQSPDKKIYDFLLGLTLALSFSFRPNNIGVQITILLSLLITAIIKKRWKEYLGKVILWLAGMGVIWCIIIIYMGERHALGAMIEAAFIYNFSYTGTHADLLSSITIAFQRLGEVAWVILAGYLCAIFLFLRQAIKHELEPFHFFLVLGWPIEIILSSLSGRGYFHYFISWLPDAALLSGLLFFLVAPLIFTKKLLALFNTRTTWVFSIIIILTGILFPESLKAYAKTFDRLLLHRAKGIQITLPVAEYVRTHTEPTEKVLVWGGQAGINLMAQRDSNTRYTFYPLFLPSPVTDKIIEGFMADLKNHPPTLLVDAYIDDRRNVLSLNEGNREDQLELGWGGWSMMAPNLQEVVDWIHSNYQLVATIGEHDVYRFHPAQ